ncbi:MAG: hypothetical protein AAF639_41610 [Chloroflexota bacterium]
MQQSLFLDSTIQLERLLYTAAHRQRIQRNLQDKRIYTSSTVYMEFKRGILQDIHYLQALINRYAPDSAELVRLSDIDRWLAIGEGNFSSRSRDRCKLVTAELKDEFDEPHVQQMELVVFLEEFSLLLDDYFFDVELADGTYFDIHAQGTYIDEAGCVLSQRDFPPGDILHHRLSCRASGTECTLDQFLARHERELDAIYHRLLAMSQNQRDEKAFTALKRVMEGGFQQALGQRNCWALGDVIIALETPQDAMIYTTNTKHFAPLCAALGKQLYIPT